MSVRSRLTSGLATAVRAAGALGPSGVPAGGSIFVGQPGVTGPQGVPGGITGNYTSDFAVSAPAVQKLKEFYSLKSDFGAKMDGTNDTAAVQTAFSSGRSFFVPPGTASVNEPVVWTKKCNVFGAGHYFSAISWSGLANNADRLTISSAVGVVDAGLGGGLRDVALVNNGIRNGRYMVVFDQTGTNLFSGYFHMDGVNIAGKAFGAAGPGPSQGSPGLRIVGDGDAPGHYLSHFKDVIFDGGVEMIQTGDSNLFDHCTMTGEWYGVRVTPQPGASQGATVRDCNIVTKKELIYADAGGYVRVEDCNMECDVAGTYASGYAVVFDSIIESGIVRSTLNTQSMAGGLLFIGGANGAGCYADGNSIITNAFANPHMLIDATRFKLGRNTLRHTSGAIQPYILTVNPGVFESAVLDPANLTFSSGWASSVTPQVSADGGRCFLHGILVAGTLTPGTVLGAVPLRFRPASQAVLVVGCFNGGAGTYGMGTIVIGTNGNITTGIIPAGTTLVQLAGLNYPFQ